MLITRTRGTYPKSAHIEITDRHRRSRMRTTYTQILAQITTYPSMRQPYHLQTTPSYNLGPGKSSLGRPWRCQVINTDWHLLTASNSSGCNDCQCCRYVLEAATSLHWQKVFAHVVLTMTAPRERNFGKGKMRIVPVVGINT